MDKIRFVDLDKDCKEIAEIYNGYIEDSTATFDTSALSEEDMREKLSKITETYPCFVSEKNGKVTGYCYAHSWKSKAAYFPTVESTIYLREETQGRGLGRRLMENLIEECRKRGFRNMIACVTAENDGSCIFHEKLGFRQVSFFSHVGEKFGRLLDVADFELKL
ncbi:MAG: GNAT family N-acetyltransferase [Muribaculaceae bacterium]|nr:GNAT family N-acetyltransferase [Muribaculaceae bacterium]MDE6755239.1 GNAT family N-acetyltransferase [Muribaculaceae bacterium]